MKIYLTYKHENPRLIDLIRLFNLKHDQNSSMALMIGRKSLTLYNRKNINQGRLKVDFFSKQNNYRCKNFSKKREILYKAIGIKKFFFPSVLDLTAGLGNDAFILSFVGCYVTMVERNPIVAALLKDGLDRAYQNQNMGKHLQKRLFFIFDDSLNLLNSKMKKPDVIYLDPMYPKRQKSALPKKNMQFFRKLIGNDSDAIELFQKSRFLANKRIVVKRPSYAKTLSKDKADFSIKSQNHRFDVYLPLKKTGVHVF